MSYRDFFYRYGIKSKWIKWIKKFSLLPDLTFSRYAIGDTSDNLSIKVTVKNIGLSVSGETFLYFNAIDTIPPPEKNEIRIQYMKNIPRLKPNEEVIRKFTLTRTDIEQNQINKIEILIDPKNLVREINEFNNTLILGI